MVPLVAIAGSPENFRDGQFIVWLAGIGPAVLFLVLEKMRRTGRSPRTEFENLVLSALFAIEGLLIHSTAGARAFLLEAGRERRSEAFRDSASFSLDGPESVR
jgi:hypothetical protein